MSNIAWLLCALIAFAYAIRWSRSELEKDVFNEPPPPVASRRVKERLVDHPPDQTSPSSTLRADKNTTVRDDDDKSIAREEDNPSSASLHDRDEQIERVQERLLALRTVERPPQVVSPVSPASEVASALSPTLDEPRLSPKPDTQRPARPEHPNDQVRREMGLARPPPPHLDMRNRSLPPHLDTKNRPNYAALTPQARNNARRPSRRSNDRPVEQYHCSSCNRYYNDLYSFDQHNLINHPEAPRLPSSADDNGELNVPVASSCEMCLRTFDTALSLLQHNAACHPVLWAAGCFQCGIPRFKTGEDAKIHYRRVHPGRNSTGPPTSNRSQQASHRNINPTLKDTIISAEPDPTLPDLQRTYGCDLCDDRFPTSEERDAHRASPFPHGDKMALAAAFPPLSSSPSNTSATSATPSTYQDTPGPSPPAYAQVAEDASSVGSTSLDLTTGDDGKEFSSLHWAFNSAPEDVVVSPASLEITDPVDDTSLQPLVISDEDWVTPWINDPVPEVTFPVVHQWQETNPADIPLPDSPIFNADPAVAIDQPLPTFSISSNYDVDDRIPFEHPAPAELVHHVSVGHGNPDGSDVIIVPSPFKFGEIIPDPVPPGLEAFPELPSRADAATPKPMPKSDAAFSRWHTDVQPDFAIPDVSPKLHTAHTPTLPDLSPTPDPAEEFARPDPSPELDTPTESLQASPNPSTDAVNEPITSVVEEQQPNSGPGETLAEEAQVSEEAIPGSPDTRLSRWDSAESPKKGLSRWASAGSGESQQGETSSRWAAEDDSPAEGSPEPVSDSSAADSWNIKKNEIEEVEEAVKEKASWNEDIDDEYADEIPGTFVGASPPVTGTNNIPLGRPRMAVAGAGSGSFPGPSPPTAHKSRYAPPPHPIARPTSQSGFPVHPSRQIPQPLHHPPQYGQAQPMSNGYHNGQPSVGHQSNGGYQPNGVSRAQTQHYSNGGHNGGHTANGSYSQPQSRPPIQAHAREPSYSAMLHVQQQVPNFAYANDTSFNAFPSASDDDQLGPIPAPPLAQPSAWAPPITASSSSQSPSAPLHSNIPNGPTSPGLYKSGASDVSETSSGGGTRFGSHFGGAIGPAGPPAPHPGPGTRGRWADRAGAPQQQPQQQQQQQPRANTLPPHMSQPLKPSPPKFDASSGWTTSIPTQPPKRSSGGKPIYDTYSEKAAKRRQAEVDRLEHIAASEVEGFGGW